MRLMSPSPIAGLVVLFLAVISVSACGLWSSHVQRGDQLVRDENWEEALRAYRKALEKDPFDESIQQKVRLTRGRAAERFQQRGLALLKEGRIEHALRALQEALRLEPTAPGPQAAYKEGLRQKEARDLTQEARRLHQLGRVEEAMDAYQRAVVLDPAEQKALDGIAALTEQAAAAQRRNQFAQRVTLRFRNAGLKEVFEGLSRAVSVNFIFDKDVRNDPITIFLHDMTFEEAMNLMLTTNNLFAQEVGPNTLLISPNTKQKQEQYQDLMIRTFYLSNAKSKDMVTLLKTMLNVKRLYANEKLNAVVVRETPGVLQLAERIIVANDRKDSEVLLEVEVLEITRTQKDTYGVDFAKQAGIGLVPDAFSGTLAQALAQQFTADQLTSVGKGNVILTLPTTLIIDFLKSVTDSKILASPKLRVGNNQKAEINIGAKEPILLSTTNVLPGSTTTGSVPTTSTVTSIEFRDTGVKLTVEPSINLHDELSLKLKIEFVRIGDSVTLQSSPLITSNRFGNRTAETTLNIKDGETIVIAGLIQEEDRRTKNTVPLLGDIPGLGALFTSFDTQRVTTEIVVTITPKVLQSMTPPSPATQAVWSGTEYFYSNRPLFLREDQHQLNLPGPETASFESRDALSGVARSEGTSSGRGHGELDAGFLGVSPADLATPVDDTFEVALVAENLGGLTEGVMSVAFDPAVLEFEGVAPGEMLERGSGKTSVDVSQDRTGGTLTLTLRRDGTAAAGTGPLAVLTFTGKAPGVSTVSVEMPSISREGKAGRPPHPGRGVVRVR